MILNIKLLTYSNDSSISLCKFKVRRNQTEDLNYRRKNRHKHHGPLDASAVRSLVAVLAASSVIRMHGSSYPQSEDKYEFHQAEAACESYRSERRSPCFPVASRR